MPDFYDLVKFFRTCPPLNQDRGGWLISSPLGGAKAYDQTRLDQPTTIRIVRTTAIMGGYGRSNPHQYTAPGASRTSARIAPVL